jgi:hypothetical protein
LGTEAVGVGEPDPGQADTGDMLQWWLEIVDPNLLES